MNFQVYLPLVSNFLKKNITLALFLIILSMISCKNSQICPELRLKNSYIFSKSHSILNMDNFLNLISKYSRSFNFLYTSTCFFICPLISFFIAIFPLPHKCFLSLFSFRTSLNCKLSIQLILKWKVNFIGKILKEFWGRQCLLFCQLKRSYWYWFLIATVIIFIANKL